MLRCVRFGLLVVVVQPVARILLGLRARHVERLPQQGPAILIANHNSHLDTLLLLALFPLGVAERVRLTGAADYWFANRALTWFSGVLLGMLPLERFRARRRGDPLASCHEALARGEIVLLYPEGTRGDPGVPQPIRGGIAKLLERCPQATQRRRARRSASRPVGSPEPTFPPSETPEPAGSTTSGLRGTRSCVRRGEPEGERSEMK